MADIQILIYFNSDLEVEATAWQAGDRWWFDPSLGAWSVSFLLIFINSFGLMIYNAMPIYPLDFRNRKK